MGGWWMTLGSFLIAVFGGGEGEFRMVGDV